MSEWLRNIRVRLWVTGGSDAWFVKGHISDGVQENGYTQGPFASELAAEEALLVVHERLKVEFPDSKSSRGEA